MAMRSRVDSEVAMPFSKSAKDHVFDLFLSVSISMHRWPKIIFIGSTSLGSKQKKIATDEY